MREGLAEGPGPIAGVELEMEQIPTHEGDLLLLRWRQPFALSESLRGGYEMFVRWRAIARVEGSGCRRCSGAYAKP